MDIKRKESAVSLKKHNTLLIVIAIISVFTLFLATGCASEAASENEDSKVSETENLSTVPDISSEDVKTEIAHNVDKNPVPLLSDDEELSLEGYGAIGALSDNDLSISDMLMWRISGHHRKIRFPEALLKHFPIRRDLSCLS